MSDSNQQRLSILRRKQVEARTGLARSTIYHHIKAGTFPRSIPENGVDVRQFRPTQGSNGHRERGIVTKLRAIAPCRAGDTDAHGEKGGLNFLIRRFNNDDRQVAGWRALLDSMTPFEQAVLITIARQLPPMGRETLKSLARVGQPAPTVAKVRAATERLRKSGIVTKDGGTSLQVEDRLFAEFLVSPQAFRL